MHQTLSAEQRDPRVADRPVPNVYLARQPIYNRGLEVVAYELLFRSDGIREQMDHPDGDQATAQVVLNTASVESPVDDPGGDNNEDSSEALGVMPVIPALGAYGLLLLLAGIGGIGIWRLRRS